MVNFLDKIFSRSQNLNYIINNISNLTNQTSAKKIFEAINSYSETSEVRYVGGCVRKIIMREVVDDIDLATNLNPIEICDALRKKEINFYETGVEHGTITAIIDKQKFEITSLRKDLSTDGRHAKVAFSRDWKEDAARRDFSINSVYSDKYGNLFDPYNGKQDLEDGFISFIGDPEVRIKEDYLRIIRYIRFFTIYSKNKHNPKVIRTIKKNIGGISKLSSERLFGELVKLFNSNKFLKLFEDKDSLELIEIIFPQLKKIDRLKKLNSFAFKKINEIDFIFLLSLMVIDGTDNIEYFFYRFNISKKDQLRMKLIDTFFKDKKNIKNFNEKYFNKIFYFDGKQAVLDIINFQIFISKKVEKNLIKIIETFKNKEAPVMPVTARYLMSKYNLPEGRTLGKKLKLLEEFWVSNNFKINEKQITKIIEN